VINHEETLRYINAVEEAKNIYNELRKGASIIGDSPESAQFKESVNSMYKKYGFNDYDDTTLTIENTLYNETVPQIRSYKPAVENYHVVTLRDDYLDDGISAPPKIEKPTITKHKKEKKSEYDPEKNNAKLDKKFVDYITTEKHIYTIEEKDWIIMHNMPESLKNMPLDNKYKDMLRKLQVLKIDTDEFNDLYLEVLHYLNVLNIKNSTPHTIIFIDDCIDLITKRGDLFKKLFENRQGRITYFLGMQDVHGIPPSMKSNMDSLVLFGGFSKMKFNSLFYQIAVDDEREDVYDDYKRLKKNDRIIISFEAGGIKKYIIGLPEDE
jgi:hypothetical protein